MRMKQVNNDVTFLLTCSQQGLYFVFLVYLSLLYVATRLSTEGNVRVLWLDFPAVWREIYSNHYYEGVSDILVCTTRCPLDEQRISLMATECLKVGVKGVKFFFFVSQYF